MLASPASKAFSEVLRFHALFLGFADVVLCQLKRRDSLPLRFVQSKGHSSVFELDSDYKWVSIQIDRIPDKVSHQNLHSAFEVGLLSTILQHESSLDKFLNIFG